MRSRTARTTYSILAKDFIHAMRGGYKPGRNDLLIGANWLCIQFSMFF